MLAYCFVSFGGENVATSLNLVLNSFKKVLKPSLVIIF